MKNLIKTYTRLIFLLGALAFTGNATGQNLIIANPAEMTDFRAAFVNPSILAFQESHAALGGKVFHVGFTDGAANAFRTGYVSLVLPTGVSSETGLGLQAQYFNTPLYSQSNISFALSRRFRHIYSFGLRFNIFSRSYNQDKFDLVDSDDPVFRNGVTQWAGTFGAGVSIFPLPFLSLGIGVDHINRANISLGDDTTYQPLAGYAGFALTAGMVQISVSSSYEDGEWLPKTSIGTTVRRKGYAMIGYGQNAIQAEGQWRISGPLSLNYNYEHTLFDNESLGSGSHAVTLIHEFNRQRELPKFELPDEFKAEFNAPDKRMDKADQFYVYSLVDKLEIIEKKLTRVIAPDITPEQLSQLTLNELGIIDSSGTETASPYDGVPVDLGLMPATLDAPISEEYEKYINNVSLVINDKGTRARVIAPKESYLRAAGLRKFFTLDSLSAKNLAFLEPVYKSYSDSLHAAKTLGSRPLKNNETLVTLSAQSTVFQITPISNVLKPTSWRLVIQAGDGREVKSFAGTGMPFTELRWDWRDTLGNLVAPDVYTYQLEWQDENNLRNTTNKKYIAVRKLLRHVNIEVRHKPIGSGVDADEIDIILKK